MTDPEATAQDPADAAPAAASAPSPAAGWEAATAPAPAARRRRRRWLAASLAAVAAAGLTAGLMLWAPWISPPVLRPAGLKAGPATANSVSLRWSRPATGPLPDRYLILSAGTVKGSAPGTATSYRLTGLVPASTHPFQVVAVRDGRRSPASAALVLATITPPLSQARLQGTWTIVPRHLFSWNTQPGRGSYHGTLSWQFSPACPAGACDVTFHGYIGNTHPLTMKLIRTGAVYQGQTVFRHFQCKGAYFIPDPVTLKVRIHITAAAGRGQVWAATAWAGTMTGATSYVSAGTVTCSPATFAASLTATPA